jgi:hypothetical protein
MDDKDKATMGTCGFYCRSCSIYAATERGRDQQRNLAAALSKEMGKTVKVADVQCQGCRSLTKQCWGISCKIRACALSKGLTFCGECPEVPCEMLSTLSESYKDILLVQLEELKRLGKEQWIEKMKTRWTCPNCGGPIEAGALKCWSCSFKCQKHVEGTIPPL